jgi:hypothetical protein
MSVLVSFLANATDAINEGANKACGNSCNKGSSVADIFSGISNALVFLVGAVAVIMIIVGAIRYVISNGDSKQVQAARDTILYAVIGLILAIAAYAIVHFVASNIK